MDQTFVNPILKQKVIKADFLDFAGKCGYFFTSPERKKLSVLVSSENIPAKICQIFSWNLYYHSFLYLSRIALELKKELRKQISRLSEAEMLTSGQDLETSGKVKRRKR